MTFEAVNLCSQPFIRQAIGLIVELPAKPDDLATALTQFYNEFPPKIEQFRNGQNLKAVVILIDTVTDLIHDNIALITSEPHKAALEVQSV